ncbi:hypothetical protein OUZ56_026149 [Daphnia magna]|uniref:Uncharacterized protein n=1 Tax=Daphnia magna TaxID=35525 RepID=A0ABQ9ZL06_9CRUS|nr:hypothetical protein OUZ56_026149 [Daphnia magna]
MDIWSQPGLDKFYLGVVAVFYNPKSPRIQAAALACRDFPRPQTGLRIRQLFEQIFVEYDLDVKKVIPEYPRPERTDDAYVEIELDIEKAYKESDDDEELLSDNESDDGNGPAEENGDPQAEKEDDVYDSEQENFPRCALLLKSAIISVCQEHVWGIDFDWADVKKIVRFLKLLAMTTTYLEGNLYPTTASSELGLSVNADWPPLALHGHPDWLDAQAKFRLRPQDTVHRYTYCLVSVCCCANTG